VMCEKEELGALLLAAACKHAYVMIFE